MNVYDKVSDFILKVKGFLSGETKGHLIKTFLVYFFVSFFMVLTKIVIARLYGQEELGIYSYFFSVASFLFLFTSFGFCEALTKKLAAGKDSLFDLFKYSALGMLVFTFPIFLLFYLFFPLADVPYMRLSFFLFVGSYSIYYLFYSVIRGKKYFAESSAYTLIWRGFFVLFLVIFVDLLFWKLLMMLSLGIFVAALCMLPRLYLLVREEKLVFEDAKKDLEKNNPKNRNISGGGSISSKEYLYLAFSLFLLQVGFYSLRTVDIYFIELLLDFSYVGIYSAYASITNVLRLVAYVFPVVMLPMAAVSNYKIRKSVFRLLFVLVPFSLLIFVLSVVFVPLFYGMEYSGQWMLAFLMVVSAGLLVLYSYFSSIFAGENKVSLFYMKLLGVDFVLSLGLNLLFNYLFISYFGLIGAPVATILVILLKILLLCYGILYLRRRKIAAVSL